MDEAQVLCDRIGIMRAYWQLTLEQLWIIALNKQNLFFTFLFPIIIMLTLRTFAGNGSNLSLTVGQIDSDETDASRDLTARFNKNEGLETITFKISKAGKKH